MNIKACAKLCTTGILEFGNMLIRSRVCVWVCKGVCRNVFWKLLVGTKANLPFMVSLQLEDTDPAEFVTVQVYSPLSEVSVL